MVLLMPFIFILCMTYYTGAMDIVTEDSVLVKSAWIEYPASIDRLPQCCTSEDCQMVRISPNLLDQTKNTNHMRVRLSEKKQQISMIVSFDSKLGGLVGRVYREDGRVQLLKPLGLEERKVKPCYVARQRTDNMGNFHKLQHDKSTLTDYAEPKFLFRSSVTPPTNKNTCCSGTICTSVTKVNMEVLKFGPTKYPDLYIPMYPLPPEDLSEVFTISFTEPPSCKSSICDLYYYQNYKKESLTITVTGNIINGHLETREGRPDLVLKKCNNYYVWTENIVAKKGITGMRAVPGPACWYPQEYCDPLHNVIRYSMKKEGPHDREDLVLECYQACQSLTNCHHFTYMAIRGKGDCYLLSDCKKTSDTCLELGTCVSGPTDCALWPDNGECAPPPQLNGDFNKWQCIDKETRKIGPVMRNPNATLPPGTVCLQSCGTWKTEAMSNRPQATGYLESQCENSGNWSETLPFGDTSLEFPLGPYPTPDAAPGDQVGPLPCTCQPLILDTNPNLEEGADFTCKQEVDWTQEEYTVVNNECHLFCDGILALTLKCLEDGWTGQPEEGFWCFQEPGSTLDNNTFGIIRSNFGISSSNREMLERFNQLENGDGKRMVRDKSINPTTETIEWTQISECLECSWVDSDNWWESWIWSCNTGKCRKEYYIVDYYVDGDKTTNVYKVYVAKEDLNIPEEFKTDGHDGMLHFGVLDYSGEGKAFFYVLHYQKWGPYQHRFKTNTMTNFFKDSIKKITAVVAGAGATAAIAGSGAVPALVAVVPAVVGTVIAAPVATAIIAGIFGVGVATITDDIFGNYLRYIG